jgi:CheY-like chemotaxis protein
MSPASVLVVEDDASLRDSLGEVLREEGFEVRTAENGRDALAVLRSGPLPRVILLDLWMPVMTGEEFRAEQLRDPLLASIPVVVISAAREGRARATALGVQGYLDKPIDLDTLLQLLQQYTR